MEAVPVEIGGILALGGAYRGIEAVVIEVNALGAGVVEYAVQNDVHPQLMSRAAEGAEILLRAQQGIDLPVVGGIIAMVGGRFKNGIQIQRGNTHGRKPCQLGGDAPEGAAEKVPVADLTVRIRPPLRHLVPAAMDPTVSHHSVRVCGIAGKAAETIWKNLVCHAGAEPVGEVALPVDGHLPAKGVSIAAVAGPVQEACGAVGPPEAEIVPHQLRLRRNGNGQSVADPFGLGAFQDHLPFLFPLGEFMAQHQRAGGKLLGCQGTAVEGDGLAAGNGPEGVLADGTAGIKDKRFAHEERKLLTAAADFRRSRRCRCHRRRNRR